MISKDCALLGGAISIGQRKPGTENAPGWLKRYELLNLLEKIFVNISDRGDFELKPQNGDSEFKILSEYSRFYAENIFQELRDQNFVLNIGGDHSLAVASLAGALKYSKRTKIIWVDAHADLNTTSTSPSGNMHGMPVALAMNIDPNPEVRKEFQWLPKLSPNSIVYIGLRSIDPGEQKALEELKIKYYTSDEVQRLGIDQVLSESREYLDPYNCAPYYISFDVDGVDPKYFPSTGTPVAGGLSLKDAKKILKEFSATGRLIGLDLVEINPLIGTEEDVKKTAASALELLSALDQPLHHGHDSTTAQHITP